MSKFIVLKTDVDPSKGTVRMSLYSPGGPVIEVADVPLPSDWRTTSDFDALAKRAVAAFMRDVADELAS